MTPRLTLPIDGMTCGHCVARVQRILAGVPAVEVHEVVVGRADISVSDQAALPALVRALDDAGFSAQVPPTA